MIDGGFLPFVSQRSNPLKFRQTMIKWSVIAEDLNTSAKPIGLSFIRNPAKLVAGLRFIAHPNLLIRLYFSAL